MWTPGRRQEADPAKSHLTRESMSQFDLSSNGFDDHKRKPGKVHAPKRVIQERG